jgi:pyridinium-3,5-biscarboxylic acid mononucleotide sulfurtransferase
MNASHHLELDAPLQDKWEQLLRRLADMQSVVVAFSGGVDSGLLSVAAHQALGERMLAVTIKSPVEASDSMAVAEKLAAQFHFPHRTIEIDDLDNVQFSANPPDRCYLCKQVNFGVIWEVARQGNFKAVIEGTNADDVTDYRPGRKAAQELNVQTPLLELGIKKPDIRAIAKALGMLNWERPSSPCLASRFPYGTRITKEGLEKVAAGEAFLQGLGHSIVRVRYGGASVRLEVAPAEINHLLENREAVVRFFKNLGFKYVVADLEGYRQGSLNEVLSAAQTALR